MSTLHDYRQFGELAEVLDLMFERYTEADKLAEARRYRDEERNARAERLAAAYDRARVQALKAKMYSVEVVTI